MPGSTVVVAAGSPTLAQEHIDQSYVVEASLFPRQPDYLLKVRGMSMRDAGILDGDLLAVQKANDAKNGQIVVARLGDGQEIEQHPVQEQPEPQALAAAAVAERYADGFDAEIRGSEADRRDRE